MAMAQKRKHDDSEGVIRDIGMALIRWHSAKIQRVTRSTFAVIGMHHSTGAFGPERVGDAFGERDVWRPGFHGGSQEG